MKIKVTCYYGGQNRAHDVFSTTTDKIVIPRVELAVRSVTGSSERVSNNVIQNYDQRDFSSNMENAQLMRTTNRRD